MKTIIQDSHLHEMTLRGVILGALITVVFTASNVYLGLKVGITFSSSIPAAVISMALLRMFSHSNILENNMVQTQASAAGTLSTIIFILPSLVMLGYWQNFPMAVTFTLCALGGFLGVLFTIPLRRAMVVTSDLPYPEGRAAAEILRAGSVDENDDKSTKKNNGLKEIIIGCGFSGIFSLCSGGFHIFSSGISTSLALGANAVSSLSLSFSTALIAAGWLIGIASGIAMIVGMFLSWGIFVPYFSSIADAIPEGMSAGDFASTIWVQNVRLIGVGVIGIAAIWTLICLVKPVVRGMLETIAVSKKNKTAQDKALHHTDIDLSPKSFLAVLLLSVIGLFFVFYNFVSSSGLDATTSFIFVFVGLVVAVVIGFLVASACGYMAGLLGSSTSPISGITILGVIISALTVLGLSELFDVFEIPNGTQFATAYAIFITSVITAIACISNDNMQDLKTGYLIGATPWRQQLALLIGCVTGAFAMAPVLNLLYEAYGFTGAMPRPDMDPAAVLSAPQATLMSTITQGIFQSSLRWDLILLGVGIGVAVIILNIILKKTKPSLTLPPLAVGFGIYLPQSLVITIFMGAVLYYLVSRYMKGYASKEHYAKADHSSVLFASGMIVGESIIGVLIALVVVITVSTGGSADPFALVGADFAPIANVLGIIAFVAIIAVFIYRTLKASK